MNESYNIPDFIQELLIASGDGLSGISTKLSMLISFPVIITDPFYNVISSSAYDQAISSIEIEMKPLSGMASEQTFFHCVISSANYHTEAVGSSITYSSQITGYIFILLHEANIQDIEEYRSLMHFASSLCALELRKKMDIKQETLRFKDAFLFDLLYGNFKKKEDILSYGQIWNWDLDQPLVVLVFSIKDYDYYSTDKQLMDILLYVVDKVLHQHHINPTTIAKRNEVIAILPTDNKHELDNRKTLIDLILHIFELINKTNLGNRVACGVGKIYLNPEEIFRSYQEAKVAFELGLLLKIDIPFFVDLGLARVLYKHDLQDLKEFYDHILGKLQRYDEVNESELMYTLEQFANNQYDLKKASEALFLHRNTLRYRIKKIEEILDQKIDDINTKLNIAAALKVKQLHKL
ncbi:hypothetical protein CVD25_18335 [Bacillus canaveralius]|uniref:PucR family transcriptional regulator n=1 Tax=Bacillus canaveralius TaxID=1403243 RepID=A0A2N5GSK0_9BACI|nr:helix-turn-helix domain-containing protein [Bacillus canaveralius]PLR86749.1 hypothetical protein CU635_00170 [Bacillus canaveralius]PLR92789.1 hypothetical protein CVD25_18335 [Bacillus canaveralius]RSK54653.1 hypothetical protein EJA13_05080 [Bacillus canaveralius]